MGYQCSNGDGNAASILLTNLDDGDSTPLCGPCFPQFILAMAATFQAQLDEPLDVDVTDSGKHTLDGVIGQPAEATHPSGEPNPDEPTDDDEDMPAALRFDSAPVKAAPKKRAPRKAAKAEPPVSV